MKNRIYHWLLNTHIHKWQPQQAFKEYGHLEFIGSECVHCHDRKLEHVSPSGCKTTIQKAFNWLNRKQDTTWEEKTDTEKLDAIYNSPRDPRLNATTASIENNIWGNEEND